jgi:hypothetical protein
MEALLDVLIYVFLIGGLALIGYGIVYAIQRKIMDIKQLPIDERILKNRAEYRAGWRDAECIITHTTHASAAKQK